MIKDRIDKLLVESGAADSLAKAQALVMSGVVLVDEVRVSKPSEIFSTAATIRIKGDSPESRYVGRGGLKLEAALVEFGVNVEGLACIDVGSSTGGFTDCLLKHGAQSVTSIDAGTNQLVWQLRNDDRVDVRENTNARYLRETDFDKQFDLAVMDVSFISVTKIIPAILPLLSATAKLIILIKPQFEVKKHEVGEGGIVTDPAKHKAVIAEVNEFATSLNLKLNGLMESPILGAEGNKEFLAFYER